jgi:hypothetical protein
LCAFAGSAGAQQPDDVRGRAVVELELARERYFVGEPIRVRLRVGFEREFLESHVVAMFQQTLDVPVQVQWPSEIEGALLLGAVELGLDDTRTFALDGEVARALFSARHTRNGREFSLLELERSFLPQRAGVLVFQPPLVRFAYATQFREDFVHGRVALDQGEALISGEAREVTIDALPSAGRPAEFEGAVGRFEISATVARTDLEVGQPFDLELTITGDGNLGHFPAPSLHRLTDLRLFGTVERPEPLARTITYSLAASSARLREIPALPFAYFDPTPPAGYTTLWTKPIPVRVSPARADPQPGFGATSPGLVSGDTALIVAAVLALAFVVVSGVIAVWIVRRRRTM